MPPGKAGPRGQTAPRLGGPYFCTRGGYLAPGGEGCGREWCPLVVRWTPGQRSGQAKALPLWGRKKFSVARKRATFALRYGSSVGQSGGAGRRRGHLIHGPGVPARRGPPRAATARRLPAPPSGGRRKKKARELFCKKRPIINCASGTGRTGFCGRTSTRTTPKSTPP